MKIVHEAIGSRPPLLLIQGLDYERWGWEPLVGPLAKSYRVITFDNRVHRVTYACAPAAATASASWLQAGPWQCLPACPGTVAFRDR